MAAALRESELIVRTCILYEVLDKKPIQESYDNFCRKVGNDVMTYSEFDFWYYRFYNGNHDLHYDRSSDPVPRSLSDMPLHTINEILNHVDIFDSFSLMKVSKNLQMIVQDNKFNIDSVDVGFYEGQYSRIQYNSCYEIFYCQEEDGCELTYYDYTTSSYKVSEIFVAGENYVDRCNEDFKLMMENQSVQLESLRLRFDDNCEQGFREKCIDGVKKALNSSRRVTSKSVETDSASFPDLAQLVAIFPSEKLENIEFDGLESEGYEQLIRLDQWKRARTLRAYWKMTAPFEHFFHFECFAVYLPQFTEDEAMKLRDMIDRSTRFRNANIYFDDMNISGLKSVFGVQNEEHNNVYQTPDKRSFDVEFCPWSFEITRTGYGIDN